MFAFLNDPPAKPLEGGSTVVAPAPAAPLPVHAPAPAVAASARVARPKKTREPGSFNISQYLDRSVEDSLTGGSYHCPHCSGSGWADPFKQGWNFVKSAFTKKKTAPGAEKKAPPPQSQRVQPPAQASSVNEKEAAHAATKARILKELNLPPNPTPADVKKAYFKASKKYHPDKGGDEHLFKVLHELKTELTGSGFDSCPHCCGGAPISGGGWGDFTSWLNKTYDDTIGKIPGVGPKLKEIIQQLPPVVAADTLGKSAQHIADGEPGKIMDTVMAAGKKLVNPKSYADILTKGTPFHKLAKRATQYAENAVQVPGTGMSLAAARGEANDLLADEDEEEEEGGGYAPVSGGGSHRVILPGSVLSRKDFITHYPGFPGPSRENHNGLSDFGELKRFWEPPYGYTPQARSQWAPVSSFPNQYDGRALSRVTGDPMDVPDTPSHPYHGAGLTGGMITQAQLSAKRAELAAANKIVSQWYDEQWKPGFRETKEWEKTWRDAYNNACRIQQELVALEDALEAQLAPQQMAGKRRRDEHGGAPVSGGVPISGGVPVSGGDGDYDYSSSEEEEDMEGGGKKRLPRNKSQRLPRYHREVLSHVRRGYGRYGKPMPSDFMHLEDPEMQYHRNVITAAQRELVKGPGHEAYRTLVSHPRPKFLTRHPGLQIYTR